MRRGFDQRLNPWVNWTTLGPPLLNPLAACRDARLIAPPPLAFKRKRDWCTVLGSVHSADTLFWMQGASRPEWPICFALSPPGRARRSAFVVDPWSTVSKIGALAVMQGLIDVLCPCVKDATS